MVNTPQQLLCLLDLACHANLTVLFDTYHVVTEIRDYPAAIRSIGSCLYALHARENDRGVPGGGLIPWHSIFQALRAVDFDGYIGLEVIIQVGRLCLPAGDVPQCVP